ncbi:MAG TPA: hypothetical protein VG963_33485 [Polyangiaceae bacterium]|nr:hypothetical protein [Polyangiaceae bacterium]
MTLPSSLPNLEWTARSGAVRGLVLAACQRGSARPLQGNRWVSGWVLASSCALSLGCASVSGSNTEDRRALDAANTEESAAVTPTTVGGVADSTVGAAGSSGSTSAVTTGTAGSSGTTTTTTTPATTDPNAPSGPPQECKGPDLPNSFGTPAPADGLLIDFSTYVMPGGSWGDSSVSEITGGTSLYSGAPADAITQSVTSGTLELKATISVGGYTGIVLWFTPCVNASKFSGLQFPASGSLGGANMIIKVQTSPDYPVDVTNTKGKCPFTADSNKYNECMQPSLTVSALTTASQILPFATLSGGLPEASVDSSQLLGFELQFQCPGTATAPCPLDLKLGTINFTP